MNKKSEFTILIKGISMFYNKGDGKWRVVFPFDRCHTVKFLGIEGTTVDSVISLAHDKAAGRQVTITSTNATTPGNIEGADLDRFLDLTEARLHSNGIQMVNRWREGSVLLEIDKGVLSMLDETRTEVKVDDAAGQTKVPAAYIGNSAKVVVEAEKLKVDATDFAEYFPVEFSKPSILLFDNDCGDLRGSVNSGRSDMQLLYDLIVDESRNSSVRYEVKRGTPPNPAGPRPLGGDPSPWRNGLPCHGVRSSKDGSLPSSI